MTTRAVRVLGIADSDSYLKWGAATLERMPESWSTDLVVVETPAVPSERQIAAALSSTVFARRGVTMSSAARIAERVARERPDVVLLSVRGPVVRVLVRAILEAGVRARAGSWRPVFVSGLPGISIPATRKALYYRAQVDAMILHSTREIDEFTALATEMGVEQTFALSTLPFLDHSPRAVEGRDIVFAAQAKVPRERSDRQYVLRELAALAAADPGRRVVLKLRGVAGEPQTHSERFPYDELLAEMPEIAERLVIETGSMARALDSAAALVTVSSTAAIEAVHRGIPVLVLDDFGVSADLINTVFEGSGLLGHLESLHSDGARQPRADWLDDNYFHGSARVDYALVVARLVDARDRDGLPVRPQFRGTVGGVLRRVWDRKRALGRYDPSVAGALALAVGLPARAVVLAGRAVVRVLRGTSAREAGVTRTRSTARL